MGTMSVWKVGYTPSEAAEAAKRAAAPVRPPPPMQAKAPPKR